MRAAEPVLRCTSGSVGGDDLRVILAGVEEGAAGRGVPLGADGEGRHAVGLLGRDPSGPAARSGQTVRGVPAHVRAGRCGVGG